MPKSSAQTISAKQIWQPSNEILVLHNNHLAAVPAVGAERAIHFTEFYKENKFHSASLFKAQALAYHLKQRSINIYPGERLVGTHTEHRIGAICYIELAGSQMLEDLFKFEKRAVNPLHVNPGARRTLALKVIPYWLSRNLIMKAFPIHKSVPYLLDQLNVKQFVIHEAGGIAHFLPDYASIIKLGTNGLRGKVEARLELESLTPKQKDQLNAQLIVLDACDQFAARYRKLALKLGQKDIAQLLENVPKHPANNLKEGLQLVWFFQMMIQIESLDQGISLGRIDQYLYPLYQKEKAEGCFNEFDFKDTFCAFCLKLSEIIPLFSERASYMYSGLPSGQAMTIGGLDEAGVDASNEVTFMLLDVLDQFKTRQPNWHARHSAKSDARYRKELFKVISRGGGSPALYNDDVIQPALKKRFSESSPTWNYATVGCVEPALSGVSFTSSDAAIFNFAKILENVLKNIAKPFMPLLISSMESLWIAFSKELNVQVNRLKSCLDSLEGANEKFHPVPFASLTVKGCIEHARDLCSGGADYNASGIQAVGLADLADSMAAIQQFVFTEQRLTMRELAIACKQNFKGLSELKARLHNFDKVGNDKASVDEIMQRLAILYDETISQHQNTRGGNWMPGIYSMTCHQSMGKNTMALPSGREAGAPLADGISPGDGNDTLGPTASLNSIAKLDLSRFANGINLNIKFDAKTMSGEHGSILLQGLIEGYFLQGGMQVQVNVLDPKILTQAKLHPEKHKNLLIRISGYSAHFVDLTPAMQDEIIRRTLQSV
mgnify:CR=1 FL=1